MYGPAGECVVIAGADGDDVPRPTALAIIKQAGLIWDTRANKGRGGLRHLDR